MLAAGCGLWPTDLLRRDHCVMTAERGSGRAGAQPAVLVVGAGPAGLAAAAACLNQGVETAVLERGRAVGARDRYNPLDIVAGVGGAGLFSDGKFSFYPSATRLWKLRPQQLLREAYQWCANLLVIHGLAAPSFPGKATAMGDLRTSLSEEFILKAYPSFYMPPEARTKLISTLAKMCAPALHVQATAYRIHLEPLSVSVNARDRSSDFEPKVLVLASGRFGPLMLQRDLGTSLLTFRRLEVGVRIEQDSSRFFLRDNQQLDPKLLGRSTSGIEWRTFCCCRNGEVVPTFVDDIASVSGRADGSPTTRSNVGFHVRLLDPNEAEPLWSDLRDRLVAAHGPLVEPVGSFLQGASTGGTALSALLGPRLSTALADGMAALRSSVQPDPLQDAVLHGPCLEGVSTYPNISDSTLQLTGYDAWVAGDATGLFRGLTAALVSGYFVGRQAAAAAGGRR